MMTRKRRAITATLTGIGLALAGCGNGESTISTDTATTIADTTTTSALVTTSGTESSISVVPSTNESTSTTQAAESTTSSSDASQARVVGEPGTVFSYGYPPIDGDEVCRTVVKGPDTTKDATIELISGDALVEAYYFTINPVGQYGELVSGVSLFVDSESDILPGLSAAPNSTDFLTIDVSYPSKGATFKANVPTVFGDVLNFTVNCDEVFKNAFSGNMTLPDGIDQVVSDQYTGLIESFDPYAPDF